MPEVHSKNECFLGVILWAVHDALQAGLLPTMQCPLVTSIFDALSQKHWTFCLLALSVGHYGAAAGSSACNSCGDGLFGLEAVLSEVEDALPGSPLSNSGGMIACQECTPRTSAPYASSFGLCTMHCRLVCCPPCNALLHRVSPRHFRRHIGHSVCSLYLQAAMELSRRQHLLTELRSWMALLATLLARLDSR